MVGKRNCDNGNEGEQRDRMITHDVELMPVPTIHKIKEAGGRDSDGVHESF